MNITFSGDETFFLIKVTTFLLYAYCSLVIIVLDTSCSIISGSRTH